MEYWNNGPGELQGWGIGQPMANPFNLKSKTAFNYPIFNHSSIPLFHHRRPEQRFEQSYSQHLPRRKLTETVRHVFRTKKEI
jgi:hypothetical protein